MRGLTGKRLLDWFLGNSWSRAETDAMNAVGLPENGNVATDRPDVPKPEKAQEKREAEPHESDGT